MPDLHPARPVRFRDSAGHEHDGWATFYNEATTLFTIEWFLPGGQRAVDYRAATDVDVVDQPKAG